MQDEPFPDSAGLPSCDCQMVETDKKEKISSIAQWNLLLWGFSLKKKGKTSRPRAPEHICKVWKAARNLNQTEFRHKIPSPPTKELRYLTCLLASAMLFLVFALTSYQIYIYIYFSPQGYAWYFSSEFSLLALPGYPFVGGSHRWLGAWL